jgi:putative DNA methylase
VHKRKLIEVALPLEAINKESGREKSIRHGHPSTLHLWWARRPLAAARAVLFAQLVDDPSSRLEEFPTEELQRTERERLHKIIERLVVWENIADEQLYAEARAEILKSTDGAPPAIHDPFAGGGTIPLEAQRLGLEARASDLNPVSVLINKALIEIPPRFGGRPPMFPGVADAEIRVWKGAEGLAADVRAYGAWLRDQAQQRIGSLYPKAKLGDGREATVIAWIWARTVTCPNPACGIEAPLVKSWWLGKKKGKEAFVVPSVGGDPEHPSGLRVEFTVGTAPSGPTVPPTMAGRQGGVCLSCQASITRDHIKTEGLAGRLDAALMAVVAEGDRRRIYCDPNDVHSKAARVDRPEDVPDAELSTHSQYMGAPLYGMVTTASLFTNRQLLALTTFCDLVAEARARAIADGAEADYADALATYLAFVVSRLTDYQSSLTTWASNPQMEILRNVFSRQALPMAWDFAEGNPFAASSGSLTKMTGAVANALERLPARGRGTVHQAPAQDGLRADALISTDPPYYDNVPYADLSDFFYVWLRRALRTVHPELTSTLLVPKAEELVADTRRHGRDGAKTFFEDGFRRVFERARATADPTLPITVYYAFRQVDRGAEGEASSGWETLLEGMIRAGWEITSTWPVRTESAGRMRDIGSNALASSIVLSLRPRPDGAGITDRRGFIADLEAELPGALRRLQQGQVAPVDLPQAAIGPGMAVFSRHAAVIESDGSRMSVRSALARINEILDQVLNEQEGDFDATTRFAIAWYRQHGYGIGRFGDADNLARARNTSVDTMDRDEILTSRAGNVQLIKPSDLSWNYDVLKDLHTSNWEALHHLIKVLERDGIAPAGSFLQYALIRPDGAVDGDLVKELAHLLFRIAEGNGWTKDALSFNALVTSWPEIMDAASGAKEATPQQGAFDFDGGDES